MHSWSTGRSYEALNHGNRFILPTQSITQPEGSDASRHWSFCTDSWSHIECYPMHHDDLLPNIEADFLSSLAFGANSTFFHSRAVGLFIIFMSFHRKGSWQWIYHVSLDWCSNSMSSQHLCIFGQVSSGMWVVQCLGAVVENTTVLLLCLMPCDLPRLYFFKYFKYFKHISKIWGLWCGVWNQARTI
jgi:hypothetical protein